MAHGMAQSANFVNLNLAVSAIQIFGQIGHKVNMVNNIRTFRIARGWTFEQLGEAMGTDASTASKLEKGKTKLSADWMQKLASAFNCTLNDLVTPGLQIVDGKIQRPRLVGSFDPDQEETEANEAVGYTRETWKPTVPGGVPEIDMKLGAGSGMVSGEILNVPVGKGAISAHPVISEWVFPEGYLRHELKVSENAILIQEIIGDSMVPTYSPGDKVIVDLSQNALKSDTVYAISDGYSEPQIKRLQRVPFSNPTQVIIISDNVNLERFTVDLEQLTIIGRVAGVVSKR
jgi:transcriptional regulator with XRE-family HTH domain